MKYIVLICFCLALASCDKEGTGMYDAAQRFIYIPDSAGMDTAFVSFKHHPGVDTYRVPFEIRLIGEKAGQDLSYGLMVVDSLTTAAAAEYKLPEHPLFGSGKYRDTLWIELLKTERLQTQEVRLVVMLVPNENFEAGYSDRLTASVTFNDMMSQPLWWDDYITINFLGEYSEKKYMEFFTCTGVSDLTDMPAWKIRQLILEFREYIEKNKITEANGEPMVVVAY